MEVYIAIWSQIENICSWILFCDNGQCKLFSNKIQSRYL